MLQVVDSDQPAAINTECESYLYFFTSSSYVNRRSRLIFFNYFRLINDCAIYPDAKVRVITA